MQKQNFFSQELITEASKKLKALNKAFRKKSFANNANSFARDRANEYLRSVGKRTFNTRGLSPSQKYIMGQAAAAFVKMKGSTPEGAIDITSNQQASFYQRLKDRANFIPENFRKYEKVLEMYSLDDLRVYFGYEDPSNFIDTIIEIGNLNKTDFNSIVKFSKTKDKYDGAHITKVEKHGKIITYDMETGEVLDTRLSKNQKKDYKMYGYDLIDELSKADYKGYGYK